MKPMPSAYPQTRSPDDLPRPLLELLDPPPRHLLEIGCHAGPLGRWLRGHDPGIQLTGLDWRPEALTAAAGAYDRLIAADPEPLDLAAAGLTPASVDAIVVSHVLELLDDPWGWLRALGRWLAPGGRLYLSVFNVRHLGVVANLAQGQWRYRRAGALDIAHRRFFTRAQLVELFAESGWQPLAMRSERDPALVERFKLNDPAMVRNIHVGPLKLEGLNAESVAELFAWRFCIQAQAVGGTAATATDTLLAGWWRELLNLERDPAPEDDFFALGGHSLLVAQLALRVEAHFGCPLPLEAFFAQPTLAVLARAIDETRAGTPAAAEPAADAAPAPSPDTPTPRWALPPELHQALWTYAGSWRGERARPDSLIVGAHTQGRRPPLFWCFQGEYEYQQLADHLDPEQPLYAMRSGHRVMDYCEDNIQALALAYLEELEALVPEGPLALGGTCQGAAIAQAMAGHLLRRGRAPRLLFLLDWVGTYHPYSGPVALLFGQDSAEFNPYRRLGVSDIPWPRLFPDVRVAQVPGQHTTLMDSPHVEVLARTIAELLEAVEPACVPRPRTPKDLLG